MFIDDSRIISNWKTGKKKKREKGLISTSNASIRTRNIRRPNNLLLISFWVKPLREMSMLSCAYAWVASEKTVSWECILKGKRYVFIFEPASLLLAAGEGKYRQTKHLELILSREISAWKIPFMERRKPLWHHRHFLPSSWMVVPNQTIIKSLVSIQLQSSLEIVINLGDHDRSLKPTSHLRRKPRNLIVKSYDKVWINMT